MRKNSETKKSLRTSGLALLLCVAMLIGTTFAWFTDSITNSGNVIQSGTLDITATVASIDKAASGTFTIEGINNGQSFGFGEALDIEAKNDQGESVNKIINETLWEPGQSSAKLLTVKNEGSLAAKIKLNFDVKDGGLENALWYDFIQVTEGAVTGQLTKREMSTLKTFAENMELPLAAKSSVQFILVYGMNESAGNEYQGKSFEADVSIAAKQDTVEADGFGNTQYDAGAYYPTDDAAAEAGNTASVDGKYYATLQEAVAVADPGATVKLIADTEVSESVLVASDDEIVLDLNGKTLSRESGTTVYVDGGTATIKNGTINSSAQAIYAKGNAVIKELNINMNSGQWGVWLNENAKIEKITGGTYKSNKPNMASFPLYISTNARIDEISGGDFQGSKAAIANYGFIGKITGGTFHGTYYDGTTPSAWVPDYSVMYRGNIEEISGGIFFQGKTSIAQNMTAFNAALDQAGCKVQDTGKTATVIYKNGSSEPYTYTGNYYEVVKK